ncbi:tyrosine-type recombinase/integrase [Polynucleobacter sinensis]|uniref:tyrosine-type recombinase/integrase n=1 Tax=Polynucleobacter sinensis TaxID=1743157 RepID=UPI000785880F|nr:tyrosine-type recombinase/integrase [Polynucleobacter sinensis]
MTTKTAVPAVNKPVKNRLTPIAESIERIRGYPSTLIVYKTNASKYYWVRFFFNGKNRIKTTKSESSKDAKTFAIQFYKDALLDVSASRKSNKRNAFSVVANQFFETTERNSNSKTYKSDINRYRQNILPFFKQQDIETITNAQLNEFVEELHKTKIKPATIKHHIVVLRKIMKYAIANQLMPNLPVFPRITGRLQTSVKRDYLTKDEYEKVVKTAEKLAAAKVKVRTQTITLQMKYLIQFMVNSFIRPSDLRVLKHKHIKKRGEGRDAWLTLNHPATKTNANEVQAMPATVGIYASLVQQLKDEKLPTKPDDYVFFPQIRENRTTAMEVISRLFKKIIEESKIEEKTGKKITLYGLRHTAIMFRLIIGNVDTLVLSRNARTSQNMIDKFYASHLTTDQVRRQLHNIPYKEVIKKISTKKVTAKKTSATTKTSSKTIQK